MFSRYKVMSYVEDQLIYSRTFKSFNNAIKVCSGFDPEVYIEIQDLVMDRTIYDSEIKEFVRELCSSFDFDEVY